MTTQQKYPWIRKASFTALIPLAALSFVACGDETVVEEAEEEGPAAATAILGEPVTIQAEVQEVVGDNVFTVGDGDTLILGTGMTDGLEEGDEVQVTGEVRNFILTGLESEGFDFDDNEADYVVDYEQELVVLAEDVEEIP